MVNPNRTHLAFQHNGTLHTLETKIKSIFPITDLAPENRLLFKEAQDSDHILITPETIFHPQGGGQPTDTGSISTQTVTFNVLSVRMDSIKDGQVLHYGRFTSPDTTFGEGETVTQKIDAEKRLLYSKYHTAGHVLGAAVRHLLQESVENFDELKASHFPDSAACEFQGSIDGKWKPEIQKRVDEYIAAVLPVEIEWWDEEDFKKEGLERLIPQERMGGMEADEKWRIVRIKGAECYPCGGTHVRTSGECGKTIVKKIARSKGNSRVSYSVAA
ncbi:ThrRS/AlaRS common domain-containing protein [Venturia nashicola]|uniref:ThrRS/AlaRS common domain-containing protein n=1 Tax=Venturia nashicola TaxID=86259 RepID=A0A4Z1NV37_9PEZI|nr:ThrRS/AlaRS common domain-containing protein [Venturia nashicola]